jgi:hypothetical protein
VGFADHADLLIALEHATNPCEHQRVVVGDHHGQWCSGRTASL